MRKYFDFEQYPIFLDKLIGNLAELGLDVTNLELDHVAVISSDKRDYINLVNDVQKFSEKVRETLVRGTPVAIFKLKSPWEYRNGFISAIEIIGPREGDNLGTRYEHAEFVLPNGFDSFMKLYPKVNWDITNKDALSFPMIKLKLDNGTQAKFHLENVIKTALKENRKEFV